MSAPGVRALREQIAELEADCGQDVVRLTGAEAVHDDPPPSPFEMCREGCSSSWVGQDS